MHFKNSDRIFKLILETGRWSGTPLLPLGDCLWPWTGNRSAVRPELSRSTIYDLPQGVVWWPGLWTHVRTSIVWVANHLCRGWPRVCLAVWEGFQIQDLPRSIAARIGEIVSSMFISLRVIQWSSSRCRKLSPGRAGWKGAIQCWFGGLHLQALPSDKSRTPAASRKL